MPSVRSCSHNAHSYLLAVAFKLDTKTPPDKLQTVKDYKVMMADLEPLKKALNGKKAEEAQRAFAKASASLGTYLAGVELPPLSDISYDNPPQCTAPAKGPCAGSPDYAY